MNQIRKGLVLQLKALQDAGVEQLPQLNQDSEHVIAFAKMLENVDVGDAEKPGAKKQQGLGQVNPDNESEIRDSAGAVKYSPSPIDMPYGNPIASNQKSDALNLLRAEVAACTRCEHLAKSRKQTVFGVGSPNTRLCFVGEAPGADEDRLGEPFVGAAGQLLTKIIEACKFQRDEVYILNVIKCRPPNNRNPNSEEINNCWGYATRQLEIIQPEYICCLGSVAARNLLQTEQSVGRMRQKFHRYRSSKVVVTYHPSYLLRTPSAKRHVWDDMKMLMAEMGVEL